MNQLVILEFTKDSSPTFLPVLLRHLGSNKHLKFNFVLPLSYLEKITETNVFEALDTDQVQLLNTCAYLTLPNAVKLADIEEELILNEYALGYYFGKKKGFEGEDAILVKDLDTLFISFPKASPEFSHMLLSAKALGYNNLVFPESVGFESGLFLDKATETHILSLGGNCLHIKVTHNMDINDFNTQLFAMTSSNDFVLLRDNFVDSDPADISLMPATPVTSLYDDVVEQPKLSQIYGYEVAPIWKDSYISGVADASIQAYLTDFISKHKSFK